MITRWKALALTALACSSASAAVLDCELNGQHVNPSNGATYAGKTGIMKCVDRETGKLQREEEYRNGRAIGYRKFVDYQGRTSIGTYNEQGNRDGEFRQLSPDGKLLSLERYANGEPMGLQTYYHANGQVSRRSYREARTTVASIEYNDRGQLMQLRCGAQPVLEDDRALCGFDGRVSDVTFYNAKGDLAGRARYQNGQRLAMAALGADGGVLRSEEAKGERLVAREHYAEGPLRLETVFVAKRRESERELAKNGQVLRETRWSDGWKTEETLWYMNGQLRSRTLWEREGRQVLVKTEEYWDNGKLRARSVRDEPRGPVGVQQRYTETGELESEAFYEQGRVVRRKAYKDGRLVSDDEYYEDGSRKSVGR